MNASALSADPGTVYIVDIETTGLNGCRYGDKIVEIGIVEVALNHEWPLPIYQAVVEHDVTEWSESQRNAWIFENTDLTLEDVKNGKPAPGVIQDVRRILNGKFATSYNTPFDFGRFLSWSPWNVHRLYAPDIMVAAHETVDGRLIFEDGSTSYPNLCDAYAKLCPEDPMETGGIQRHRALFDAMQAAFILLSLKRMGYYPKKLDIPNALETVI